MTGPRNISTHKIPSTDAPRDNEESANKKRITSMVIQLQKGFRISDDVNSPIFKISRSRVDVKSA
ncbi:hypothetical protein CHS0354_034575, partial [Potamilus streckersoni]